MATIRKLPPEEQGMAADLVPVPLGIDDLALPPRELCGNGHAPPHVLTAMRASERHSARLFSAQARINQHPVHHAFDPTVPYFWKNLRVAVTVRVRYGSDFSSRPLDDDNMWRGLKSKLDGLQDAHIVANDRQLFMSGKIEWVKVEPLRGGVDLVLTADTTEVLNYDDERPAAAAEQPGTAEALDAGPDAPAVVPADQRMGTQPVEVDRDRQPGDRTTDGAAAREPAARPQARRRPARGDDPPADRLHSGPDRPAAQGSEGEAPEQQHSDTLISRQHLATLVARAFTAVDAGELALPVRTPQVRAWVLAQHHFASAFGILDPLSLDLLLVLLSDNLYGTEVYVRELAPDQFDQLRYLCPMCHAVMPESKTYGDPALHDRECMVPDLLRLHTRAKQLHDAFAKTVGTIRRSLDELWLVRQATPPAPEDERARARAQSKARLKAVK